MTMGINKSDIEEAKIEAMKTKIRDNNGNPLPIWSTPLSKLRNYGLGLWLYMLFLKWMAAISIILSICITPAVI